MTARAFAVDWLVGKLAVKHVVVGFHFFFGKGREGTPDTLKALGQELGFGVTVVAPEGTQDEVFSSTRVRELLAEGHVRDAADMLGHWWRITGTVVGGNHIGTGMGFPTANIHLPKGVQLHHGIYGVRVRHQGVTLQGRRLPRHPPDVRQWTCPSSKSSCSTSPRRSTATPSISISSPSCARTPSSARWKRLMAQMDKDCEAARVAVEAADRDDPMDAYPLGRMS